MIDLSEMTVLSEPANMLDIAIDRAAWPSISTLSLSELQIASTEGRDIVRGLSISDRRPALPQTYVLSHVVQQYIPRQFPNIGVR
jgi:hypothetical protein